MKQYKANSKKYDRRFNYFVSDTGIYFRVTKTWWKPFYWLGSRNWLRYGVDKFINLFIPWKGKTLKQRWNYWGGGGIVCDWCKKHLTFD